MILKLFAELSNDALLFLSGLMSTSLERRQTIDTWDSTSGPVQEVENRTLTDEIMDEMLSVMRDETRRAINQGIFEVNDTSKRVNNENGDSGGNSSDLSDINNGTNSKIQSIDTGKRNVLLKPHGQKISCQKCIAMFQALAVVDPFFTKQALFELGYAEQADDGIIYSEYR